MEELLVYKESLFETVKYDVELFYGLFLMCSCFWRCYEFL